MLRRLLLISLAGGLCACSGGRLSLAPGEKGEVVESEGWAPVDAKDALGTKTRALAEAQRKAVERVVGVYISAKTRVAQAVDVDQNILAKVGGYVRKYDVLSEREEGGFHKTRIKAVVLYEKVGEDLRKAGLLGRSPAAGNPKIVVLMATRGEYAESADGRAAQGVRRGLLEKGFAVVDRNDPLAFGSRRSTDSASAVGVGRELAADLVVRGEAEAVPLRDVRLGGFFSSRATVSLEVLRPDGRVVASRTQEASALDPSPLLAAGKALDTAGLLSGEGLSNDLAGALGSRVQVTLRVLGVASLAELQRFAEDVRLIPEVLEVSLASFDREKGAELAVATEKTPGDELAAAMLRMRKYSLTIAAVSPYEVVLDVRPQIR
ncbi:MAG: hypothetical protein WC969_12320 [Elusimicrobiota bacterium]|jgi:hypothetical protein